MLVGTIAGALTFFDFLYLFKSIKKYSKLLSLLHRLSTQKYLNVQQLHNLLKNELPGTKLPTIVRGTIKTQQPLTKQVLISAITSIPIYQSDHLNQYRFEKIPYHEILHKATDVQPKKFQSLSFSLKDLYTDDKVLIQSLAATDVSGSFTEFKSFQTKVKTLEKFVYKLKSFVNKVFFLNPFKFAIKKGEKVTYYNIMHDNFAYVIGQAKKLANGDIVIQNPQYMTKQVQFVINKIKNKISLFRYFLGIVIIAKVVLLAYLLKWLYQKYGHKLNLFRSSDAQQEEENVPFHQACIICYSSQRSIIFKPCKHYGVCNNCYKRFGQDKKCPICKQDIQGIIQIIKK